MGTPIWNYTTGSDVKSSPAVADNKVYIGSLDNNIYCLNASTGAYIWHYTTGNYVFSSPAIVDGIVYVGGFDGKVYAFGALTSKYSIEFEGFIYQSTITSNSLISNLTFSQPIKEISFNVTGEPTTSGFCNITFPTQLLGGPYSVLVDGSQRTPVVTSNTTHTNLYITYTHSTHKVKIIGTTAIPEFPTFITTMTLLTASKFDEGESLVKTWKNRV